jgi:hypothetical protein
MPDTVATPKRKRAAEAGGIVADADTANTALAEAVPILAVTVRLPVAVLGTTTLAENQPLAEVLIAAATPAMVTVPDAFLGNDVPVTVMTVPTGPDTGLRVIKPPAALAGVADSRTAASPTVDPITNDRRDDDIGESMARYLSQK